jgi:hypothetical protein
LPKLNATRFRIEAGRSRDWLFAIFMDLSGSPGSH